MQTDNNFLGINDPKLGKLTQILPIPIPLISNHKGRPHIILQPLILNKQYLIDHIAHILPVLVDNGSNPTQVWGDQIILLPVLEHIPDQQLPIPLIVIPLKVLRQDIRIMHILTLGQLLGELLIVMLARGVLLPGELGQGLVYLFLELVLEGLERVVRVYVQFHQLWEGYYWVAKRLAVEGLVG